MRKPPLPWISLILMHAVLVQAAFAASEPLSFSRVQLQGELGARYWAATCNLLTRTDRYSFETFASSAAGKPGALWWDWPGDQIGRWLSVLHVAAGYGWAPAAEHRQRIAEAVLPLRTDDGRFGPVGAEPDKDVRLLSGNAFCLRGWMDAYADTGDARCLEAARQLGHYFEAHAEAWETRRDGKLHEFYGHCIDGLVALHEQAGDDWALALAERLAVHAGRTPHTHHSLSLCRGLVDLGRVTKKPEYLRTVEDYLSWCQEHQNVTGGLPESMPKSPQDEGCGLADWIVVNLMMYQATGRYRYVDAAEHTLINHFFLNQFNTGGFGHLSLSDEIVGGKGWQGWEARF
ncbi:MAG: glycoside hydrolase family 127 protein, partial [Pirellulales bacterium]|nr:glycoside hydrolase family 127 protein [Pirellulales bacterium]